MTQVFNQIRSVTQLCPTLCNPMNRSTPQSFLLQKEAISKAVQLNVKLIWRMTLRVGGVDKSRYLKTKLAAILPKFHYSLYTLVLKYLSLTLSPCLSY